MAGLLRVLLVEDSEFDAELVAHELRRSGYDIALEVVDTASDLTAALKRRWDLIICDHRLPGLQSLDALRLVGDSGADAPFIVLSGAIGEEAAVEALKAGARDVVLKANLSRLGPVVERELHEAENRRRHREAEEALRESEGRFRSMATNVPGVIYRCALDADWTMEFISDEIEKMTGHPASDFIGNSTRTYASVIHPDDRAMVERVVCESVAAGQRYAIEYRVTCVDGSTRWVYERGRAITGDPGEALWLDGAIFDISERKRAE
jgi:PAS domain S-box-containing protein